MNKKDLIIKISTDTGVSRPMVSRFLDSLVNTVEGELKKGEQIKVSGFGTFSITSVSARLARNPRTGESVQIPATKRPHFKPSDQLKLKVK